VDGIPFFVNGLGGRNFHSFSTPLAQSVVRYNSNYGAMLVDANTVNMTFKFVTISGVVIDTYSISSSAITPLAHTHMDQNANGHRANSDTNQNSDSHT